MTAVGTASPPPFFGSVLQRPGTSYSAEKPNAANLERLSVTAGCSRTLVDSLNQRRPSLQRLHTPFRGSNRVCQEISRTTVSNVQEMDDSLFNDEFSAMQDRKLWDTLLRFIDDISISIQNEDLEQLHKILFFDQGNFPKSPSRFFRSAMAVRGDVHLGSGFGGDHQFEAIDRGSAEPSHPGQFREILGEIFDFFEKHFPKLRWDFKRQLQEDEAMQLLLADNGVKKIAEKKAALLQEEPAQEVEPVKLNARQMLQIKIEAERAERAENLRLLQEGKVKVMQQTSLQIRCSEFCTQIPKNAVSLCNPQKGTYRMKDDGKKKQAWQKIQREWKADATRLALRLCDRVKSMHHQSLCVY